MGPKDWVVRWYTPRLSSKVYVNPAEEAPIGKVEIWAAMPAFTCFSTAWASAWETKWAAWLNAGFGLAARITGFCGEKKVRRTFARSPLDVWARALEGMKTR